MGEAGEADDDDATDPGYDSATAVARLVGLGVGIGIVVTGIAGALPGDQALNALSWVATVATIAALVTAVGIYRVQRHDEGEAHRELLDRLNAQDQLLADFASVVKPDAERHDRTADRDDPTEQDDDVLTPTQRAAVERAYGADSIDAAWDVGRGRGNRPRMVRLKNGELVSVYSGGRAGRTLVRAVDPERRGARTRGGRRN